MSYLNSVCKNCKGSKFILVDDSKPTREPDVKAVDILRMKYVARLKGAFLATTTLCSELFLDLIRPANSTVNVSTHSFL